MPSTVMKGYDMGKALAFMLPRLDENDIKSLWDQREALLREAILADMAYMARAGVIDDKGQPAGAFYDDDEAYDAIFAALKAYAASARALGAFVDQFMDLQEAFLTEEGLLGWE